MTPPSDGAGLPAHPELPVDPDAELGRREQHRPRPLHVRSGPLASVAVGGAFGAAARTGVDNVLRPIHGLPVATLTVNIVGTLALGVLLETLARRGPDVGRNQRARLVAGTGFCGALTTYSTFAVEADLLLRTGRPAIALAYAATTVLAGLSAAALGIWAAGTHHRRRRRETR